MRRLFVVFLFIFPGLVFSENYPSKPIRFVVSFPPGGSADLVARVIAPRLAERLGQQVVVENKPGAGGNIGVDVVAKAPPDGHTIGLAAAGALSLNSSLYTNMPFNPEKDLAPITMLAMIPFVLIGNPSLPAHDLRELIAAAKAKPGSIAYGHGGNASAMHLSGELLKMMAGIDLTPIPYKGSGPVATDVLGGQVPLGVVDLPAAIANVKAGRLKGLAVTTSRRVSIAPEIPTFAEAGVPGYESIGWFGAVAPAGTPASIIARLNSEMAAALAVPEARERMLSAGVEPLAGTPQEFAAFIRDENRKWAKVIKAANIRVE